MTDEFSATCGKCDATGTGKSYDEAESNIRCALKLNDHGICKQYRHLAKCNGKPAYEVTRTAITKGADGRAHIRETTAEEESSDKPKKPRK